MMTQTMYKVCLLFKICQKRKQKFSSSSLSLAAMLSGPGFQPSVNTRVQLQFEINGLLCTSLAIGTICYDNSFLWPTSTPPPYSASLTMFQPHKASSCSLNRLTCFYLRAFALAAPSAKNRFLSGESCASLWSQNKFHLFKWAFSDPFSTFYFVLWTKFIYNCPFCIFPTADFISSLTLRPIRHAILFIYLIVHHSSFH